jgi:Mrp family chromosome partitioning ATPase
MIKQFVNDVAWGEIDYLIIDTPPGTSDEHITIAETLRGYSPKAVIVTTPQAVSLADVKREISFCRKVGIDITGLVENMSGFICPHCAVLEAYTGMLGYFLDGWWRGFGGECWHLVFGTHTA